MYLGQVGGRLEGAFEFFATQVLPRVRSQATATAWAVQRRIHQHVGTRGHEQVGARGQLIGIDEGALTVKDRAYRAAVLLSAAAVAEPAP